MTNKKRILATSRIGDPSESLLRERVYDLEVFQRLGEEECVGQPHLADQLKLLALSCKQLEEVLRFWQPFHVTE